MMDLPASVPTCDFMCSRRSSRVLMRKTAPRLPAKRPSSASIAPYWLGSGLGMACLSSWLILPCSCRSLVSSMRMAGAPSGPSGSFWYISRTCIRHQDFIEISNGFPAGGCRVVSLLALFPSGACWIQFAHVTSGSCMLHSWAKFELAAKLKNAIQICQAHGLCLSTGTR